MPRPGFIGAFPTFQSHDFRHGCLYVESSEGGRGGLKRIEALPSSLENFWKFLVVSKLKLLLLLIWKNVTWSERKCHVIRVRAENLKNTDCFSNGRCVFWPTMRITRQLFSTWSDHMIFLLRSRIQNRNHVRISNGSFTTLVILFW